MVELKCQRCTKEWNYRGQSTYWASCPNCRTTVKIPRTDDEQKKN